MLLSARSSVFWPGLTADVNNMAKNCETCQKHAPKQGQEQIFVHEPTATKSWSKLASDIFDIKGKSYIVIADYYSRFPYVKQLPNITSRSIINVFKTLFADHGFCDMLVTDNGPSYVSQEFETFLRDCSIKHITSSPMYPQSNGFAESMVKVMKNLITKSFEANEDPNWALLAYRATPLVHHYHHQLKCYMVGHYALIYHPPGLLPRTMISRMLNIIVSNPTHNYQNHHYPNYNMGRVLPCTTTTPIHGNLLQLPMCYLLLDPTCSLQITEEVIVETGVIYVLFPQ